jgi:hypothetical protein
MVLVPRGLMHSLDFIALLSAPVRVQRGEMYLKYPFFAI